MNGERWSRVEQICHEVLERAPVERAPYLDHACAGDADLRREVESLIGQQSAADRFLEWRPLESGTHLDRYELVAHLASGGMGDVYEARDTRLGRRVAIKVLPGLATDPGRQRFEREARAASALNHPHICTLHDIGADGDVHFLVMERLDGQTLSERLRDGPLPLPQALEYAGQIAAALGAAHAHGIVHRDLKPANIMLTSTGAKLLDFGLAKLKPAGVVAASGERGGDHGHMTGPLVFGTLPYMAPEQLAGKETDARTDLFAFGSVLYEMVTGRRPFTGDSDAALISSITLLQPPSVASIEPATPPALDRLIERCLRKDPRDRPGSAQELAEALNRIAADRQIDETSHTGTAAIKAVPRFAGAVRTRTAAVAGGLILALGVVTWLLRSPHQTEAAALRVLPLTTLKGYSRNPTFSPDGQQVAFAWNGEWEDNLDIYVKLVGSAEVRRLTSDRAPEYAPRWSPDGQEIAFIRGGFGRGTLHVMSPRGGTAREVSEFTAAYGLDWSPDGQWIAAGHLEEGSSDRDDVGGIYLISPRSGAPHLLVQAHPPAVLHSPTFAPEGRRLAYASCQSAGCSPYIVDLDAAYRPVGAPRQLAHPTREIISTAWARDGRSVIFGTEDNAFLNYLWRVMADGSREPERIEVAGLGAFQAATVFSRDRLAFARKTGDVDLYRFVAGGPPQSVAASSFRDEEGSLSADGRRLAFMSARSADAAQIWVSDADGAHPLQVTRGTSMTGSPSWSPDARQLAFDSFDEDAHFHLWIMDADGGHRRPLTADPGDQNRPTWSADGQWIYFSWAQGDQRDIWRMHPAGGVKERLTADGAGDLAEESADGAHVLYQRVDADGPLFTLGLNGGIAQQLVPCVSRQAFAVAATGIYYVPCLRSASDATLRLLNPDTGTDRLVGTLDNYYRVDPILTVSRDGQTILYGRGSETADLMLIENFR